METVSHPTSAHELDCKLDYRVTALTTNREFDKDSKGILCTYSSYVRIHLVYIFILCTYSSYVHIHLMYVFILCTYSSYVRIHLVYIRIYLMYILLCKCNNPSAVFRNFSGWGQVKVLRRGILMGCECAPPPKCPPVATKCSVCSSHL